MSIFYAAISEMSAKGLNIYGPKSFKAYMRENKLPEKGTAANISIDSIEKLNLELKENKLMILRLGAKKGERETSFVLVRLSNSWSDFFLIDKDLTNELINNMNIRLNDLMEEYKLLLNSNLNLINI